MNSKIKNILLEGILIGTMTLSGCNNNIKEPEYVKAKVTCINETANSGKGDNYNIYINAQNDTTPYLIKVYSNTKKGLFSDELHSKIHVEDSILFPSVPRVNLDDIKVVYRKSE
ncbi:MAG: hypothetical protein ACP5N1_06435 [Candidatus Woesearchaeota archaeon]